MYKLILYTEYYDDSFYEDIIGIFSSREKAEKAKQDFEERNATYDDDVIIEWRIEIEPVEMDKLWEDKTLLSWTCSDEAGEAMVEQTIKGAEK